MQGTTAPVTVSVADLGTFNSATSLSLNNLPSGMTGAFSPGSFAAPGAGTSTLSLQPSLSTLPGTYSINVVGSGGGLVKSVPLGVTVTAAPNFTFSLSLPVLTIQAGQAAGQVTLAVKNLTANFNAPVSFSVTGLPSGIISTLSVTSLGAPGSGISTLTLSAPVTVAAGQYKVIITAAGGTVSQSAPLQLTVIGVPGFTLKTDVSTLSLTAGATFTTTVSVVAQNGFNSSVSLALGTLPAGITGSLSANTITSPTGTVTLTIQTASTLPNGSYGISLSGASSVIAAALPSQTANIAVAIGSVHTTLSSSALSIARGNSWHNNSYRGRHKLHRRRNVLSKRPAALHQLRVLANIVCRFRINQPESYPDRKRQNRYIHRPGSNGRRRHGHAGAAAVDNSIMPHARTAF